MYEQKKAVIIPEGRFEGNCYSCAYAKKKSMNSEGKIFCRGEPGGYNFPHEKEGCRYYLSKIRYWIRMIIVVYFSLIGFYLIGQIISSLFR